MSGEGKILFVKAVAPSKWQDDQVLKEELIDVAGGYKEIEIPKGTNKINFNTPGMKATIKVK